MMPISNLTKRSIIPFTSTIQGLFTLKEEAHCHNKNHITHTGSFASFGMEPHHTPSSNSQTHIIIFLARYPYSPSLSPLGSDTACKHKYVRRYIYIYIINIIVS